MEGGKTEDDNKRNFDTYWKDKCVKDYCIEPYDPCRDYPGWFGINFYGARPIKKGNCPPQQQPPQPQQPPQLQDVPIENLSQTIIFQRHAFSCANLAKQKWLFKDDIDSSLCLFGILSTLFLPRTNKYFEGTAFVSMLIRTWQTAILEFAHSTPKLVLIISPFIIENGMGKSNMPSDEVVQNYMMLQFMTVLQNIHSLTPEANAALRLKLEKILECDILIQKEGRTVFQYTNGTVQAYSKMTGGFRLPTYHFIYNPETIGPYEFRYTPTTLPTENIYTTYFGGVGFIYFAQWASRFNLDTIYVVGHSKFMKEVVTLYARVPTTETKKLFDENLWRFKVDHNNILLSHGMQKPENLEMTEEPLCYLNIKSSQQYLTFVDAHPSIRIKDVNHITVKGEEVKFVDGNMIRVNDGVRVKIVDDKLYEVKTLDPKKVKIVKGYLVQIVDTKVKLIHGKAFKIVMENGVVQEKEVDDVVIILENQLVLVKNGKISLVSSDRHVTLRNGIELAKEVSQQDGMLIEIEDNVVVHFDGDDTFYTMENGQVKLLDKDRIYSKSIEDLKPRTIEEERKKTVRLYDPKPPPKETKKSSRWFPTMQWEKTPENTLRVKTRIKDYDHYPPLHAATEDKAPPEADTTPAPTGKEAEFKMCKKLTSDEFAELFMKYSDALYRFMNTIDSRSDKDIKVFMIRNQEFFQSFMTCSNLLHLSNLRYVIDDKLMRLRNLPNSLLRKGIQVIIAWLNFNGRLTQSFEIDTSDLVVINIIKTLEKIYNLLKNKEFIRFFCWLCSTTSNHIFPYLALDKKTHCFTLLDLIVFRMIEFKLKNSEYLLLYLDTILILIEYGARFSKSNKLLPLEPGELYSYFFTNVVDILMKDEYYNSNELFLRVITDKSKSLLTGGKTRRFKGTSSSKTSLRRLLVKHATRRALPYKGKTRSKVNRR